MTVDKEIPKLSAEVLLSKLLEHFYVSSNGGLEWAYTKGIPLNELVSDDFEIALLPYLNGKAAEDLRELHDASYRKPVVG